MQELAPKHRTYSVATVYLVRGIKILNLRAQLNQVSVIHIIQI